MTSIQLKKGFFFLMATSVLFCMAFTKAPDSFVNKQELSRTEINWEEYDKVRAYVYAQVCKPLRESKQNKTKSKTAMFSRCPSGYQAEITTKEEEVLPENMVLGKIELYTGCSPDYICDFKVCVKQGLALVKTPSMKEYVSVSEFLGKSDSKPTVVVKG